MKISHVLAAALIVACGAAMPARAGCGESKAKAGEKAATTCGLVRKEATMKDGVREITYEQFSKIRESGEKYVLLDVLAEGSYKEGHIEGALNLPVNRITQDSAAALIPAKDATVVVYCGSFKCPASTNGAAKLGELGYKNVLDYKGGLKEWKEKGNALVK